MSTDSQPTNEIAMNLTRTRLTILVFNLTIISLMLKLASSGNISEDSISLTNLTSSLASYTGFCLTMLGILLYLFSQSIDAIGNSKLWPYMLGTLTTYLALSQTLTAFMHEFLIRFKLGLSNPESPKLDVTSSLDQLGDSALIVLFIMGGILWILITYVAPVTNVWRSNIPVRKRWLLGLYYFALQVPIYWIYAKAWQLEYVPGDQPVNFLSLFLYQFIQPFLWIIA